MAVYQSVCIMSTFFNWCGYGRAMAQAVSRWPLTAEARVWTRVSLCGICGGQSDIGTGFSPITSVFPCQFHSTDAPLLGKIKNLIIFITGLHNKPQGCGAYVASTAGPFTTKPLMWIKFGTDGLVMPRSAGKSVDVMTLPCLTACGTLPW
jgi:hypothetical protein